MDATYFTKTLLRIQRTFNFYDPLSLGAAKEFLKPSHYPVFIVGTPRSGSTLLYQLLLKQGGFAYISNLMALMPGLAIVLAKMFKELQRVNKIKPSNYGYIPGIFSPNEAGAIFEKWFNSYPPEESIKRIRNTFIQLSRTFNAPLLSKNLKNSFRLPVIFKVLPEAKFIFVTRDPLFNAQSILLARRKLFGDDYVWWSVAPEGYEKILDKDPIYQVLWQVIETNKQIESFLKSYPVEYIEISYEALCDDMEKEINKLIKQLRLFSAEKRIESIPIKNRNQIKLDCPEWEKLKAFLNTPSQ